MAYGSYSHYFAARLVRSTDQLLVAIVSGEGAVIVALVAWTWRALAGQVKQTATDLQHLTNVLDRHLSWHEGLDDRNAWRGGRS